MRKTAIILLIGFFLFNTSCRAISGGNGEGYIVYTAVDQDGNPLRELVVLDANGKELRRINLPDKQGLGNINTGYTFIHPSHRALVYNPGVAAYLVDVLSGEVRPILIPGSIMDQTRPISIDQCASNSSGNNVWALICDRNIAYLINFETADVYDILPHPSGDQRFPYQIWFSLDKTHIGISSNGEVFILSAAKPEAIRQVGMSDKIAYADFSADNKRIVYVRPGVSQGYEVVVEAIDGSQPDVLYTSDGPIQAVFVPRQDQILVVGGENILLLSLAGRIEKEFPAQAGFSMRPIFSPQGGQALVGYHGTEVGTYNWQWLDLKRGLAKELPGLVKKQIESQAFRGQRWMLFSETTILEQGSSVDLTSLDLQTGSVQPLPTMEDVNGFNETSATADGKFRTEVTHNNGTSQSEFWLVDLAGGKLHRTTQEDIAEGAVSPDGKKIVVYTAHREGAQLQGNIVLQDTSGKILKSLGDGDTPFWVRP